MKKILLTFLSILLISQIAYAKSNNHRLDLAIKKTTISKGSISFSFRDLKTGKVVQELNSHNQVTPASTQKVLTTIPSLYTLGENYQFSTKLYKAKNGDYYLVLGADPYLTSKDLKNLLSYIKLEKWGELKNLYIDDSILDKKTWGEGWQWDDDLNTLMPKFGAYNLDRNLYTIVVKPTRINNPADIFTELFYPTSFINKTITSATKTKLTLERENYISPDTLTVNGKVAETTKVQIPVNHLKRYFILRIDEALRDNKISYYGKYPIGKLPANSTLVAQISHPINMAMTDAIKNSNNLVTETLFKVAGGKYTKSTGTHASAMAMFNNYCANNNLDCTNIRLTDGSGVSKNNLVTADFMSQYLYATQNRLGYDKTKHLLATPSEGTLKLRMLSLKDQLYAKTGTLSNISGITGYLDTKNGKSYAFAIYITDGKSNEASKKMLEEFIIREAYKKL